VLLPPAIVVAIDVRFTRLGSLECHHGIGFVFGVATGRSTDGP
jgi:hypothetical protein